MGDIAEEGREEENYKNLCKQLSEFHCTMLGVDSALGVAGDRRLPSKQKSKGFDSPPAVGDAENPTPGEEPSAAAPLASADGAAAASETPPTPPPARRGAGGRG